MEVVTYTKPTGSEKSLKYEKAEAKFMLMVANCGVMRCPIDKDGNVLDGVWLNDNEWVKTIDEAKELAQMSLDLNRETESSKYSNRSLIDDTLLFENDSAVIWYSKANRLLPQFYSSKNLSPVPHPQLVFFVAKNMNRLSVVAINDLSRPTLYSKVFHAPLANLYEDTHLCLGTAQLPKHKDSRNIAAMEECLLGSRYSGFKFKSINIPNEQLKQGITQSIDFWASLQNKSEFPVETLVNLKNCQNLGEWIDSQFSAIGSSW